MANSEQLATLRRGVDVWNRWRKENPQAQIDLRCADLEGMKLKAVNLAGANLRKVKLVRANLQRANLRHADLTKADLRDADLYKADLARANLLKTDFSRATLNKTNLVHVAAEKANFSNAQMVKANLVSGRFSKAKFAHSALNGGNLTHANFEKANLGFCSLEGAMLPYTQFTGANLSAANLTNVSAEDALFDGANLSLARLHNAILAFSNFRNANLAEAHLEGANLRAARFRNANVASVKFDRNIFWKILKETRLNPRSLWKRRDDIVLDTTIRCKGTNIAACYGSQHFRVFIQDQDFLEEYIAVGRGRRACFIWWLFADCGRSVVRWAMWSTFIILAFSWLYSWAGQTCFVAEYLEYDFFTWLYYSIVTFTTLGFGDIVPKTHLGTLIVSIEVVLGYIMLGGLISIFAGKLARRA